MLSYESTYVGGERKWVVWGENGDVVATVEDEDLARKIMCIPLLIDAVEAGIGVMEDAPLDPEIVQACEKMKEARDAAKGEDNG